MMAAGCQVGLWHRQYKACTIGNKIPMRIHRFRDNRYPRLKVFGNLKIQDEGLSTFWIFIFAIYSINRVKSNIDENKTNFVNLAANRIEVIDNLKIQYDDSPPCCMLTLIVALYSIRYRNSNSE